MREPTHLDQTPQRLFELQRQARWKVAARSAAERIATLKRLRQAVIAHRAEIAQAIAADFQKPPVETELTEVLIVLQELNDAIRHTARWMKPRKVATPLTLFGTRSEIRAEPKGVVLVMAPWNYPFQLLVGPLVAAIAAGNCVILKPSEKTPATAKAIHALISKTFDPSEVAVVEGDASTARALLELPFDHIFFTGSTPVGRKVMEAAARHLASVTLELGGKSPAIVDPSADVRAAGEAITWGKFINGGQTCVAPDYVLVPEAQRAALVEAIRATAERFYGPEADRAKSPDFCRLVDPPAFRRLKALLDDAVARGAKVEMGGQTDEAQRYLAPTVLSGVPADAAIMQEEIFGPILPLLTYRDREEVFRQVDGGSKPLALYVFSRDARATEALLHRTTAGGTVVNNTVIHLANGNLPFGGVGASGMGSYHGEFGFRAFSHERAVLRQGRKNFAAMFFPPYGTATMKRSLGLLRRLVG